MKRVFKIFNLFLILLTVFFISSCEFFDDEIIFEFVTYPKEVYTNNDSIQEAYNTITVKRDNDIFTLQEVIEKHGRIKGFNFSIPGEKELVIYFRNARLTFNYTVITVASKVELNKEEINLYLNEEEQLEAVVNPTSARNKDITWESSNTNVVTVVDGLVKAIGTGTATITVKTVEGNFTDTCTVKVIKPVEGVSFVEETLEISLGENKELEYNVYPIGEVNDSVTFESSDETIAKVVNGEVVGVSVGTATITIKTVEGNFTDTCEVTVTESKADPVVSGITGVSNLVYNTNSLELITQGTTTGGTLKYCIKDTEPTDEEYLETIPTAINAGTYKVWYKVFGNSQFNDSLASSLDVTISKADAVIDVDTTFILKEYGEELELPTATSLAGVVSCDKTVSDLFYCGSYYVTYSVEESENYKAAQEVLTVMIIPVSETLLIISDDDEKIYDGTKLTCSTYTYTSDILIEGDVLEVTITGEITNVGFVDNEISSYKVLRGEKDVTDCYTIDTYTGTLYINPKEVEKPIADTSVYTYNGSEQSYNIIPSDDYTITNDTRTIAGSQTVTVSLNNDNYVWEDSTTDDLEFTFNIEKIPTAITITASSASKTFDNTALISSEYTYTTGILVAGDTLTATVEGSITNVGTTENKVVSYTIKNIDNVDVTNCYLVDTVDGELTITASITKITKPTADNTIFTYNTQNQTYNIASNDNYTVTGNVQKDAGEYDVTVSLNNKTNYCWDDDSTEDLTFKFTINKYVLSDPYLTDYSLEYTGYAQSPTLHNYSASIMKLSDDSVDQATDVDWYKIYIILTNNNYEFSTNSGYELLWEITKANALTMAPTPNLFIEAYNGEAQELCFEGYGSEGKWLYKVDDGEYSENIPTATDAGVHTVYFKFDGGKNYWSIDEDSFEVIIDKGSRTAPTPTVSERNGVSVVLGLVEEALYGYNTENTAPSSWSESNSIGDLTGYTTYYFFCKYPGTTNYNESVSSGVKVTTKRVITCTFSGVTSTDLYSGYIIEDDVTTLTFHVEKTDPEKSYTQPNCSGATLNLNEATGVLILTNITGNVDISLSTCCVAKGTLINMADGTVKKVEDIVVGDRVLTVDHFTGITEGEEVYYIYADSACPTFQLIFSDGTKLNLVNSHYLFELESLSYVEISYNNAKSFIGKHYYSDNAKGFIELTDVNYNIEQLERYTLYTKNNINFFAEGMLNVSEDTSVILNAFKFNEDLTIDLDQLALDIETYGLYEYYEDHMYDEETFNFMLLQYLNISVGKGLVTWEELIENTQEYLDYINE